MTHARLAAWGGIALMFALSAALYTRLPAAMPTHLGWQGPAVGEMPRWIGAFRLPVIGLLVYAGKQLALRRRCEGVTLEILSLASVGFFVALHVIMLRAALDPTLDAGRLILICVSAFSCVTGNYLGKVRRNRWVGIRTPWTLASDEVWLRAHRLAGRLFVFTGVVSLCAISAGAPPQLGGGLLLSAAAISALYSYVVSRQLANR